jgi:hypothetical protein
MVNSMLGTSLGRVDTAVQHTEPYIALNVLITTNNLP